MKKCLSISPGFWFTSRLLAREVYDKCVEKVVQKKWPSLLEKKIIPSTANYFICTVESMPKDKNVEFVAIDEIQMCADRERGHIFTERLLESEVQNLLCFWFSSYGKYPELVSNVKFEKRTDTQN